MNINDPKFNPYYKLRNRTVNWLKTDSEEMFLENLKTRYEEMQKHGWVTRKITYSFNNDGFRCENFSNDNNIVFLGCSVTVGIGLSLELIYPEIVSKEIKLKCCNLAISGTGSNTAFRHALHYIPLLKPKIVVYGCRFPGRYELLDIDGPINYCVPKKENSLNIEDNWYKTFLTTEENIFLNEQKNKLAVEFICNKENIKFIDLSNIKIPKMDDRARDLIHGGIGQQNFLAKETLNLIN